MKRILSAFILILIVPQIATAAWWSPASWFKQKPVDTEEIKVDTKNSKPDIAVISDMQTPVKEKIVEKVITVSDPKLQAQINDLVRENTELKNTLNKQSSIVQALNQCKADLTNSKTANSNVVISAEYQNKKDKWAQLDNELTDLVNSAIDNSETVSIGTIISTRERINEIIKAYQYIDSKVNLKVIPDYLSPGGQGTRDKFKNAYVQLRSDLDWYIKYR